MRETYAIRGRKISLQSAEDLIPTKLPQNEAPSSTVGRCVHNSSGIVYQILAILFCVLFGVAMIVNTQLGGEGEWFWYARLFHSGAKLYADLHLALQPLYVLETNAWIQLFGIKCLVTEIPSVIYLLALCFGILLILRESNWPDWQKAIVLASAFLICVKCTAYRFDDFHVLTDILVLYSLALLLLLAKTDEVRRQSVVASALGMLSGLTITTRLTDGAALLVAAGVCVLFLTRKRKLFVASLFIVATALTVICIVKLTGDSFSEYVSNSIISAAGAKGGTHNILEAPFLIFRSAFEMRHGRKWLFLWVIAMVGVGALVQRYWKIGIGYIVLVQLGVAGIAYTFSSHYHREQLLSGTFVTFISLLLLDVNYLLLPLIAIRYLQAKIGDKGREWDRLEILILIPLAELASVSASTGGQALTIFLSPIAMLLLLVPVIQPFRSRASWAKASLITIMALMGFCTIMEKIHDPYSWILFRSSPMFVNRQWYQHPVYGPMYIDRDLLHFIQPVCQDIGNGTPKPELLSMPFSYPNYFCDTPPWHGYVQTFFDTSTRSTITHLMSELNTAPPKWIVYQRQMKVMTEHEESFHQGQPLAHRDLDNMIMQKISTGQWQVVRKSNYLFVDTNDYQEGDGWWIIRTRP
jgi:hypothetical protein